MDVTETALPGVLLIRPRVHCDERGSFRETWRKERYGALGVPLNFVQDNAAASRRGVIRGLHYQWPNPQGKLVSVLHGEVMDVVVDIRRGSSMFGQWVAERLSADNARQLWIPEGFAHGYAVLSETAIITYKCTRTYDPDTDRSIAPLDPMLGIEWSVDWPVLSKKDAGASRLADVPPQHLPS